MAHHPSTAESFCGEPVEECGHLLGFIKIGKECHALLR
jgi:hypothetical protein